MIPYDQIPEEAKKQILLVIEHPTQEGGWKLTNNPNDPDGGWTYAGVTATTWYKHMGVRVPFADLQRELNDPVFPHEKMQADVIAIYYNEFYLPVLAYVQSHFGPSATFVCGDELSCIVNLGQQAFEQIYLEMLQDKEREHDVGFLYHWMKHYIQLVQKNAEAWRDFAIQEADHNKELKMLAHQEPATLRAEFLLGWYNRVEFWRDNPSV